MTAEKPPLLICNPDEEGWYHGVANVGSIADYCHHPIRISAAGVGLLLTTPGMQTVCFRCTPSGAKEFRLAPEVKQQFEEETGQPLTPALVGLVQVVASAVARRNPPRR